MHLKSRHSSSPLTPFSFQMVTRTKKIFVGGLSANTVVEDVKQYFEQFGKVRLLLFLTCKKTEMYLIVNVTQRKYIFIDNCGDLKALSILVFLVLSTEN